MDCPGTSTTAFFKSKEDVVSYVNEALTKLDREDISQWITIMKRAGSEGYSATRVITSSSAT